MIEFKDVIKEYPNGFRAVDNLNLTVRDGEICVLIGPSGCGKTTALRMVNRLIDVTRGEILINGQPNDEFEPEVLRRQIGYAIQQIGLLPHMTIRDNVAIVPRLLDWDEERVRQRVDLLLDMVGIDPGIQGDKYPRQLSGGQQQRVGVARALGADPPIMLMDEPFGAVDPITRAILQEEFLQIQQEVGKTIIFVTHDIDEAIYMGDRIALLRAGRLVQYDTPDDLLALPRDDFVREFVGTDRSLKRLHLISVRDSMMNNVPCCDDDATLQEVTACLDRHHSDSAFVVDAGNGKLLGWVERPALVEYGSLSEAMHHAPAASIAVPEDATAREALSVLLSHSFDLTPVIDAEGVLTGGVSIQRLQDLVEEPGIHAAMQRERGR
ncbi:MAG: ATP-binding cassette domain-containing protein [Anaerolineae bacterium]|nr:ATP-binding cassette domain-containing protein [Anaerolineae bacterium]